MSVRREGPFGLGRWSGAAVAAACAAACVVPGDSPFGPLDDIPPVVVDTIPFEGVDGVPVDVRPEIRFSEAMDWDGITDDHVSLRSGAVATEATIDFSRIAFHTLIVVPVEPLVPDVDWTLTVSGEITDAFFNPLGEDFVVRFRTASDPEPFVLVESDPEDGAEDVPVDADITLVLSRPVAANSLTLANFRLRTADDDTVRYGLAADGDLVILTPREPLDAGAGYVVTVAAGTAAATGQRLESAESVTFSTTEAD